VLIDDGPTAGQPEGTHELTAVPIFGAGNTGMGIARVFAVRGAEERGLVARGATTRVGGHIHVGSGSLEAISGAPSVVEAITDPSQMDEMVRTAFGFRLPVLLHPQVRGHGGSRRLRGRLLHALPGV